MSWGQLPPLARATILLYGALFCLLAVVVCAGALALELARK